MIQRKQTLFLAFAVIMLLLLFVFPVYSLEKGEEQVAMLVYGYSLFDTSFLPLLLLTVGSVVLLTAAIFMYKNRLVQVKLCNLATLMITGLVVAIFYFAEDAKSLPRFEGFEAVIQPALVCPLAALVLTILARNFIKKDEELVRSADRLR